MSLNSSHIFVTPSPTTSPWTLRSIRGLERQPQHLLASLHECGLTPNWQWRPRWSCTMPVLSAHWCTAARRGPHMPDRRKDSIPSTWEASAVSLAYPAKIECPTPRSCPELTFRACSLCSDSAGCVGWGMSTAWRMTASQKTFSMESWHLEGDPKAAHNCATRMSARETWKHLTSTPIPGRTLRWPHDVEKHPEPTLQDNAMCYSNLIKINTSLFTQELSRHFKVMFLNTQSVRNKTTDICDHVMHANVDFIFLCETWLRPEGDESDCVALTPPGFCFRSFPGMSGAGGGLAVLYRNSLTKNIAVSTRDFVFTAFEICEVRISLDSHTVVFLSVYRPPPPPPPPPPHLVERANWQMQCSWNSLLICLNQMLLVTNFCSGWS